MRDDEAGSSFSGCGGAVGLDVEESRLACFELSLRLEELLTGEVVLLKADS